MKRYNSEGLRMTDCCGCYSTYMVEEGGDEVLCCKKCFREVGFGEGDGNERRVPTKVNKSSSGSHPIAEEESDHD